VPKIRERQSFCEEVVDARDRRAATGRRVGEGAVRRELVAAAAVAEPLGDRSPGREAVVVSGRRIVARERDSRAPRRAQRKVQSSVMPA
jgi:hypothetical protein